MAEQMKFKKKVKTRETSPNISIFTMNVNGKIPIKEIIQLEWGGGVPALCYFQKKSQKHKNIERLKVKA